MKRKIILLIFVLLFITGCSVDYNLEIEDEKITETTTFTQEVNSKYTKDYIYSLYNEEYPVFSDQEFQYYAPTEKLSEYTYYKKDIEESSNKYIVTYKANYDINNYQKSRMLNTAYKLYSVGYDFKDQCYYIIANDLKIFDQKNDITNINISIKLNNYEVIDSNSTSKKDDVYIWNFKDGESGSINIKFREKTDNNSDDNKKNNDSKEKYKPNGTGYEIYIFCGALIMIVLLGYYAFNKMKERNNKMDD